MTFLRRWVAGTLPVLLALVLVVVGLRAAQPHDVTRSDAWQLINEPQAGPFSISGNVAGLFPGANKPLPVTLTNSNTYQLRIDSLAAVIGTPSNAGCAASNLVIDGFTLPVLLPANGTLTLQTTAQMLGTAPDACQGASFPIAYSGIGQRIDGIPTAINVSPIVAKLKSPLKVTLGKLQASLRIEGTTTPLVGKTLIFTVHGGQEICRGLTNSSGTVTCNDLVVDLRALVNLEYSARFLGDAMYAPSIKLGPLVTL